MATGDIFTNVVEKRIMGFEDFGDRMLGYLRELVRETTQRAFARDAVFTTKLTLAADGADAFQVGGASIATDGQGNFLDPANGVMTALNFENDNAVVYYVGMARVNRPTGVQVNPRTGMPEFKAWEEEIGEQGEPDDVVDNGNGTLTFTVDSVCEAGVSNAGRQVLVYKKNPGRDATTDGVAIETRTVAFTGGANKITTAADFGQDAASVLPSDYVVILLGPSVKRNTDLRASSSHFFVGTVTGAGAGNPPAVFSTTDQEVISGSLGSLDDVTRVDSHGRMKIDVKADASDVDEPQIVVRNAAGTIVFSVDEDGDVVISGTTTQQNVVQVNSNETITGTLTAGDNDGDSHSVQGTWTHNAGGVPKFVVDGASGRVGIGGSPNGTHALTLTGDTSVVGNIEPSTDNTRDLGAPGLRWANLYVTNLVFADLLPDADNTRTLGSASFRWATVVASRHRMQPSTTEPTTDDGDLWSFEREAWWTSGALEQFALQTARQRVNGAVSSFDTNPLANWTERPNAKNFGLNAIAYGGGGGTTRNHWVAVGNADGTDAYIIASANGFSWTEKANPKNFDLYSVCVPLNSTTWVAVGNADGTDAYIITGGPVGAWTERTNPKNFALRGVAHSTQVGLFVAVGDADGTDAYIVTSPTGVTWTERTNPKNFRLNAVCYSQQLTLYVAVGNADGTDAYIVTSPDGITWTERTNPVNQNLRAVDWGGGIFVAVGDGGYIVTSPDGITWTRRQPEATPTGGSLAWGSASNYTGVRYSGFEWVIVGDTDAGLSDADAPILVTTDPTVVPNLSTNTKNWRWMTNPKLFNLKACSYGGKINASQGYWVAVGAADGTDAYVITSLAR